MYDINANTDSTFVSFTPGIQENVVLEAVKYEPADKEGKKDKVLRFVFRGPKGEIHTETLFPINKESTVQAALRWNRNPDDVLREETQALTGKIMHIMTTYIPKEQAYMTATSWEDFCNQVITKMGDTFKGVPVRIKLVLNSKDYLSLPKRAKAPFIQKMGEASKLIINPKYDNVVYKPKAAAVEDPFAAKTPAADVPFSGQQGGSGEAFVF